MYRRPPRAAASTTSPITQAGRPRDRAIFNGGIGMVLVVPPAATALTVRLAGERGVPAWHIGDVYPAEAIGGRYAEGQLA